MNKALEIPTQSQKLFTEPYKKGWRGGGGCEGRARKKRTDRHVTHLQGFSFFFFFFFYFLLSIHITISPRMCHQDFMVPLCSLFLHFPSVHFMSVFIDLGSENVAHLSCIFESPHGLALRSATRRRCDYAQRPRSVPLTARANSILLGPKHTTLWRWPHERDDFHPRAPSAHIPKPPFLTGVRVIFQCVGHEAGESGH